VEKETPYPVGSARGDDSIDVLGLAQLEGHVGVEEAELGEEADAVILGELGPEGVDGNVDGPPVSLELEDVAHNLGSTAPNGLAEPVKVLKVGLVEGVPDDLNVHLVQILLGETGGKVRG